MGDTIEIYRFTRYFSGIEYYSILLQVLKVNDTPFTSGNY